METNRTTEIEEYKIEQKGTRLLFAMILYFIADFFPIIIGFFYTPQSLRLINYVSIGQYIANVIILQQIIGRLSFCSIFITLSFIFHQTHIILYVFDIDADMLFDSYNVFSENITSQATWFVIQTNCILLSGMLLGIHFSTVFKTNSDNEKKTDYNAIVEVCKYLMFVGILLLLYRHYLRYSIGVNEGYVATLGKTAVSNGFIITFSYFFFISFCIWIKYSQRSKAFITSLILIYTAIEIIYMSTGNRYEPIVSLLLIAYYYKNRFYSKLKPQQIIILLITVLIVCQLTVFISKARTETNIVDYASFEYLSPNDFFKSFFGEFGNSIYNVCQCFSYYSRGFSLVHFFEIGSIFLHIIPGLASISEKTIVLTMYVLGLPNYTNMGGSFIGELYFWGGINGFILALPIGLIIGYYEKERVNGSVLHILLKTSVQFSLLFIVRGYLYENLRTIVWFIIVATIFYNSIVNKKTYSNRNASGDTHDSMHFSS